MLVFLLAATRLLAEPAPEDYKLVWSEEFNGTTLDKTKWKIRGSGPRLVGVVDPAKNGKEIDIFEFPVKAGGQLHQTLHWNGCGKHEKPNFNWQ